MLGQGYASLDRGTGTMYCDYAVLWLQNEISGFPFAFLFDLIPIDGDKHETTG